MRTWLRLSFVVGLTTLAISGYAQAPAPITALSFSPDNKFLAVGTTGQVVIYDTSNWQVAYTTNKVEDTIRSLAWKPDNSAVAFGHGKIGVSGKVSLWTLSSADNMPVIAEQADNIESIEFKADGQSLLIGADDNKACFIPSIAGKDRSILDEHNGRVNAVSFSSGKDGLFVTGSLDKMVKVWMESTKKVIVNFDQPEAGITGLAWLSNGVQMVGSCLDGRLYWWGVYQDQKRKTWGGYFIRRIDAHSGGVNALAASGNRARIISAGENNTASVWDMNSGGNIRVFHEPQHPVYAVSLNSDGKMAAGGGRDTVVWVWDVEANKLITTLTLPALPIPAPSATPKPITPKPVSKNKKS